MMTQQSLGLDLNVRQTRKARFLQQMQTVIPWADLVSVIEPYYPEGLRGRPPFALESMLRVHFLQQWFALSDAAMEEAFFDTPLFCRFARLDEHGRLPDESTILRFRRRLEEHKLADKLLAAVNQHLTERGLLLKSGTLVDATLIAAPASTKNKDKARDPDMHSSKKGNQWYFGMKAHIGVDADSGLVHTVRATGGNVHDITEANSLLHGQETHAQGDAGYQGADQRADAPEGLQWHAAMKPGKRRKLREGKTAWGQMIDRAENIMAGIRAKVEHPFRVIKRQFGYVKVRYRGLVKNAAQIKTLFALGNLYLARHELMKTAR